MTPDLDVVWDGSGYLNVAPEVRKEGTLHPTPQTRCARCGRQRYLQACGQCAAWYQRGYRARRDARAAGRGSSVTREP